MIVDSHCHLDQIDLTPFNGDISEVINQAEEQGVAYMLCVCITMDNFPEVFNISSQYVNVFASLGVHPAEENTHDPSVEELIKHADHANVVAIGETGLDYFHCKGDVTWQQDRFRRHITAAKVLRKPLIIHTRDAREDTLKIMREENVQEVGGVMHCFTETWEMAEQAIDMGFYISFSGIVTFKNAKALQDVAKRVPLERMLIETDSPYLAPVPYRGKPNQPAYVRHVAEYIAELRGITFKEVAAATTKNFFDLFTHATAS